MTTAIQQKLDDLHQVFDQFKKANDEKLKQLETKGAIDPLTQEKLDKLNDRIEKAQTFLTQFNVAQNRPYFSQKMQTGETMTHSFQNYIRKGEVGTDMEVKTLSAQSHGGYLIPQGTMNKIHQSLSRLSPIREYARVSQINTDSLDMLIQKGQADSGWAAEMAEREVTDTPDFVKVKISVHEIYAKPRATQKLLDDSQIDLENWLIDSVGEKFSSMENHAFINGDGQGKPRGILSYETTAVGSGEWGKFESIATGADGGFESEEVLFDLFSSLKPEYLPGAVWLMSRSVLAQIRKFKDKATGSYLWQPNLGNEGPSTLLGHSVLIVDELPAIKSGEKSKSVIFGNLKEAYQIVDRSGLHVLRDPYSAKPYVEFYVTKRVGGDVVNFDALKILNFSE